MTAITLPTGETVSIPDDKLQIIRESVQLALTTAQPYLTNVPPDNRRKMAKMAAGTVDFVGKTLELAIANPHLIPPCEDLDAFSRDMTTVATLRSLLQPLNKLVDLMEETQMLCASRAYTAALGCYQAFKAAAKRNLPGALTIVNELAARWPGRRTKAPANPGSDSK